MFNPAEITLLCLLAISLLAAANLHGKPKTGKHSFWASLVSSALTIALCYWAGLFR